ncbi:hypothetical protein [Stagnihabitans tardus]|uniref:Nitrogen fixation protein n=1 Tax=Stagnihabitans tardus TaxID=2699202 RepID=A0AAE4Y7K5_9RHOB|nr:hypothetical protein [Stagnihabitans tardus]NBZ87268.1 hypothetical protein [Stagnihabitans tardus]
MARGEGDFAPVLACPSAPATPGAGLLGVATPDGHIAYLRTLMQVDADFLATARAAGVPEARMRFTHECQTSACRQWTGSACGVITRVLDAMGPGLSPPAKLSPCPIRGTCRWFAQEGPVACTACAEVLTDTREPA